MHFLSIIGYVCAGIVLAIIAVLFIYLIRKQEHIKALPKWYYVLAIVALIIGLAAIGFVISGGVISESIRRAAQQAEDNKEAANYIIDLLK